MGDVTEFALDAPGLDFQFLDTVGFERVGWAINAEVFGLCTSAVGADVCDISVSGVWKPIKFSPGPDAKIIEGELTSGTFGAVYNGA